MRYIDRIAEHITTPTTFGSRKRSAFYPSEASVVLRTNKLTIGKCHRAIGYSWAGTPKSNPTDARGMWTMNFGKEIENMYTEYTKQIGIWLANNVKYYDPIHNVSGEADIIINESLKITSSDGKTISTGQPVGVEIKTAYGYGFQKKVTQFPKIDNLLQVALYLDWFKLPYWRLVYHSRDTMECVEYIIRIVEDEKGRHLTVDDIPYRGFYMQDIYDRYAKLGLFINIEKLPPRDYTYGFTMEDTMSRLSSGEISKSACAAIKAGKKVDSDWQCLYCDYLDTCWAEKRKEILNKQKEVK